MISFKNNLHFISEHGAECFLAEKKVAGAVKNVAKKPKDLLIEAYEDMFKLGAFKGSELDVVVEKVEKVAITEKKEDKVNYNFYRIYIFSFFLVLIKSC